MKHIQIGEIRQVRDRKTKALSYKVSLFDKGFKQRFNSLYEAKLFCEDSARSFLADGKTTAVCIKYKRISGFASYIMYDYLWSDQEKKKSIKKVINEFEETEFEYMDSHSWYLPYWKKSQKVNERSYCAGDVLRASITNSPRTAMGIIAFSSLVFVLVLILLSIIFFNIDRYMKDFTGTANTMIFIQAAIVLGSLITTIIPYVKTLKVVRSHQSNFNEVDWKEILRYRRLFAVITIWLLGFATLMCAGLIILTDEISFSTASASKHTKNALVALILIFALRLLVLLVTRMVVYYKMARLLDHLYADTEWDDFKKWLSTNDPIWEFRTNADFFIFPYDYSWEYVVAEKARSMSLLGASDTEEIKLYAKKTLKNFKVALKSYQDKKGEQDVNIQ